MFINKNFASQILTDAGVLYLNPGINLEDIFEGSVIFTATGTQVTGTFACTAQLQGSNDAAFATGVVNLGAPVVMANTVLSAIPLSGTQLAHAYYRVQLTGAGTQSSTIIGTVTIKGRS